MRGRRLFRLYSLCFKARDVFHFRSKGNTRHPHTALSSAETSIGKQPGKRKLGRSEREREERWEEVPFPKFPARFISPYQVSAPFFLSVQSKRDCRDDCRRPLWRIESFGWNRVKIFCAHSIFVSTIPKKIEIMASDFIRPHWKQCGFKSRAHGTVFGSLRSDQRF